MTNTIVTTFVKVIGASVTNKAANHAEKPEKFNGQNFKRWQQKMFFYLTTLNLARFLKKTTPYVEPPKKGQTSNAQYNVYSKTTTAKELWESLERKYKTEDAGTKHFLVALFLDYKMVDSKNVISQEMSVEDLVVRLRIEEDNKLAQKDIYAPDSAKANMVKHAGSSSKSNFKGKGKDKRKNDKKIKGKAEYLAPKVGIVKQKFQGTCYNCNLVAVDNGEKLYIGNSATTDIKGEGVVILKITSEKELKLTNVLYVLEIRKNLIKDEAIDKFVLYETEVKNQLGKKIKVVRSDRGDEYMSPFANLCVKHGIRHEFTAHCSPQ
ncbi:zinc finger, CCHC-type containing protein [Tanacetum coccineum]